MDLGFPGGPAIDRIAKTGSANAIDFPRGLTTSKDWETRPFEFSFSGLKTAVARYLEATPTYAKNDVADDALTLVLCGDVPLIHPDTLKTLIASPDKFTTLPRMMLLKLPSFRLPEITCPPSGPTHTGKALELLHEKVKSEVRKGTPDQKGDWRPLLFLFTDGKPSDPLLYSEMIPRVKALNFAAIVGCAAGSLADDSQLQLLADHVVHLAVADSTTLKQFFTWVSDTIESGNRSMGTTDTLLLPPPPANEHFVI
ncbi:MAG: hypothetical protein EBZ77_07595 [Chitinophagia bacterium]|nr:hypothetical protein [Chitinophagia bacterium]